MMMRPIAEGLKEEEKDFIAIFRDDNPESSKIDDWEIEDFDEEMRIYNLTVGEENSEKDNYFDSLMNEISNLIG